MPNITLPVMIQSMVIQEQGMTIYYPQIVELCNVAIQNKINRQLYNSTVQLINDQYSEQGISSFQEMIGTFEVKTNERNVLSITFSNYAYAPYAAHGLTLMKSLTFDLNSGYLYLLEDLFKPESDYVTYISENIKQQIEDREIPVLEPFTSISKNQDFYIADKALVIYFPVYALTPGYYGFPMFPISVYELQHIINEEGPLGVMLGD